MARFASFNGPEVFTSIDRMDRINLRRLTAPLSKAEYWAKNANGSRGEPF
jgi:hypothetical protein